MAFHRRRRTMVIQEESRPAVLDFAPAHSCGGLVAAVGLVLATGVGLLTTLPGAPTASLFPVWATWALRVAPILAVLLLWAVAHEAQYQVRAEPTAIHFRRGLSGSVRVPWREVTDYFADCGRSLPDVASAGGSLVHPPDDPAAPFFTYCPDYALISERGAFVLTDRLSGIAALAQEVVRHTPPNLPGRWEEASWVTCPRCRERTAYSVWPLPPGQSVGYCDACGMPRLSPAGAAVEGVCECGGTTSVEAAACGGCGDPIAAPEGFLLERRGAVRRGDSWRPPAPEPQATGDEPPAEAPASEDGGDDAPEPGDRRPIPAGD
jgi:hypothetical protein